MMLRRELLAMLGVGCGACWAGGFWEKKEPAEWSADEIEKMKSNSPWAKRVPLHLKNTQMDAGGSRGSFGGIRGADSNGISYSRGRGNGPGSSGGGSVQVTVRWESAKPMLEAMKWSLPGAFENCYAVSVTGMPRAVVILAATGGESQTAAADPAARQKASVQRLLDGTSLTAKGYAARKAGFVVQSNDLASLIFGFAKTDTPFSLDDREIVFEMALSVATLQVKFETKEMAVKGKLAV